MSTNLDEANGCSTLECFVCIEIQTPPAKLKTSSNFRPRLTCDPTFFQFNAFKTLDNKKLEQINQMFIAFPRNILSNIKLRISKIF